MANMYGCLMGRLLAQLVVIPTTAGTVIHMCLTVVYACIVATLGTIIEPHDILILSKLLSPSGADRARVSQRRPREAEA